MDDIRSAMTILDQERQVRRFSEISDSTSFFYRCACKLGFHKLGISGVLGILLLGLRVCKGCNRHAVDGHAVLSVSKSSIFLLRREDGLPGLYVVALVVPTKVRLVLVAEHARTIYTQFHTHSALSTLHSFCVSVLEFCTRSKRLHSWCMAHLDWQHRNEPGHGRGQRSAVGGQMGQRRDDSLFEHGRSIMRINISHNHKNKKKK